MKILFLLLIFPAMVFAQQKQKHYAIKQAAIITLNVAAGFLEGEREVCRNDYSRYLRVHPHANPQWSNPKVSFVNKYRNYPTDKREKFIGSKTVFAWATDKHHMNGTGRNLFLVGGTCITLSLYEKPSLKQIIKQGLINWGSFALGTGIAHYLYR